MLQSRILFSCLLSAIVKLDSIQFNSENGTVVIENEADWDTYILTTENENLVTNLNKNPQLHTIRVINDVKKMPQYSPGFQYIKKYIIDSQVDSFEFGLFFNKAVEEIILNENIKSISGLTGSSISKINLDNVKIIQDDAFQYCKNLLKVNLSSVEEINKNAFKFSGLSGEIDIPGLKRLGDQAFAYTEITKFVIYSSDILSSELFTNCFFLHLIIKKEVQDIRPSLLFATNISFNLQITFEEGSPFTIDENYVIKGSELILVLPFKEEKSLILSQNITKIGENAFTHAYNLTELTINQNFFPAKFLLKNAYHLKKIYFMSNQIHYLDTEMFAYCYSLLYITFNSRIISVGRFCFFQCFKLTYIPWIENVKHLEIFSFYQCLNLRVVNISNVQIISKYCFMKCQGLYEVITGSNLGCIGDCAFYSCIRLKTFELGKIITITQFVFAHSGLEKLTIPNTVVYIDPTAFAVCRRLKIKISNDHPIYRVTDTEIIAKENNAVICIFGINGPRYTASNDVYFIHPLISFNDNSFLFKMPDNLVEEQRSIMIDPYDIGVAQLKLSNSILSLDSFNYPERKICWPKHDIMEFRSFYYSSKVTVPEGYYGDSNVKIGECNYSDFKLSAPDTEYPLNRFADEVVNKMKSYEIILMVVAIILIIAIISLIVYYFACVKNNNNDGEESDVMP